MCFLSFLIAIFLSWISELKLSLILLISFNLNFVWSLIPDVLAASIKFSLFVFKITKKYIVIFFNIITWKKTSKISFAWFLPPNIKSMNPVQKYPHIIELFYWTLKILVFMFLCSINFSISLGACSTPKLSKQTISIFL